MALEDQHWAGVPERESCSAPPPVPTHSDTLLRFMDSQQHPESVEGPGLTTASLVALRSHDDCAAELTCCATSLCASTAIEESRSAMQNSSPRAQRPSSSHAARSNATQPGQQQAAGALPLAPPSPASKLVRPQTAPMSPSSNGDAAIAALPRCRQARAVPQEAVIHKSEPQTTEPNAAVTGGRGARLSDSKRSRDRWTSAVGSVTLSPSAHQACVWFCRSPCLCALCFCCWFLLRCCCPFACSQSSRSADDSPWSGA